jgi:glycerophosphoryl diester phosphodiesterase
MRPIRHIATLATAALVAAGVVSAPAASAKTDWAKLRVLNIAHQGGEDEFPSNTMYAFKKSMAAGADMIELDIGVTKDNKVVVMHDTSVDRTSSGTGFIKDKTLAQIRKLDNAYWFNKSSNHYSHDLASSKYPFRGIATGKKKAPRGFTRADFRVTTLEEVLKAFPTTPINIEIKGRDKAETDDQYVQNAEVLAKLLKKYKKRTDINVASFNQAGLDKFHSLLPDVDLAPATAGAANYLLGGGSPGPGIKIFQMPITFNLGGTLYQVSTKENIAKAHADGYAWDVWFSDDGESVATWNRMIDYCADGLMTAQPVKLERLLNKRHIKRPGTAGGTDPCA